MHQGRLRLLLLMVVSLNILLVFNWWPLASQPPVAYAHAFVIGSDPIDGSTVATMPALIRIFFDEDISPASIAHVLGPDYGIVDASRSRIADGNPRELDTPVRTPGLLAPGSYQVRWTALANDDGHVTSGIIGFDVGHSSAGLSGQVILGPSSSNHLPTLNTQGVLAVAWEWLVWLALTLWVGMLVMEGLVVDGIERSLVSAQIRKQAVPLQWLCLAALLMGECINLLLRSTRLTQELGSNGIDLGVLRQLVFDTNYGHLWLLRVALLVVALGLLRSTTRQQNNAPDMALPLLLPKHRTSTRFSQLRQQVVQEQRITREPPREEEQGTITEVSSQEVPVQGEEREKGEQSAIALTGPKPLAHAPRRTYTFAWLLLAGLILLTLAPAEDVTQRVSFHVSAIVLNWLYLAAQCIWFGGAAYLAYVLLRLLPAIERDQHMETLVALLRRYIPLALAAFAVFLVTGLFLGEASISNTQQLLNDPYGRALLVKLLLLTLMLVPGGYAFFFLCPRLIRQAILLPVVNAELPARRTRQSALEQTEHMLRRTMILQSCLGAGVLLCAALMTFFAPPPVFPALDYAALANSSAPPATTTQTLQTQHIGDLSVTLLVSPGRVQSANIVIVTLVDGQGNPVTNAKLQLSTNMVVMDMGRANATVTGSGSPVYTATFAKNAAFSMAGPWQIVVRIVRPNAAPLQGTFQVTVGA